MDDMRDDFEDDELGEDDLLLGDVPLLREDDIDTGIVPDLAEDEFDPAHPETLPPGFGLDGVE
jgi:hypothetical protein